LHAKECARLSDQAARDTLQQDGIADRVVFMPCVEWFARRDDSYQQEVLPVGVRARVSVEAGIAQTLYKEFGIAAEHVVTAAKASLARVRAR
jgi:transketolase